MAQHVWQSIDDGTAHFCAQCRMRVDNDEFVHGVEDSLCVPQTRTEAEFIAEATQPTYLLTAADKASGIGFVPPTLDDMIAEAAEAIVDADDAPVIDYPRDLIAFCKFMGWPELNPFQRTMLERIQRDLGG